MFLTPLAQRSRHHSEGKQLQQQIKMSSGFVTETELAEARQKRQEEWEKVRQPEDPIERPEEPYDSRSLFDRLKEQRDKKDLEFEETQKLKNLIRGLDEDEVNFLDIVDKAKLDAEKKLQKQDDSELTEFRERVATLREQTIDKKINTEKTAVKPRLANPSARPSQRSILAGIVRKRSANDNGEQQKNDKIADSSQAKISKLNGNEVFRGGDHLDGTSINNKSNEKVSNASTTTTSSCTTIKTTATESNTKAMDLSMHDTGAMKCIGILPGIGKYRDSSDSEKSTDTDEDYDFSDFDWVGRKVKKGHEDGCHE